MIDLSHRNHEIRSMLGVSMEQFHILVSHADQLFMDIVIAQNSSWKHFVELGTYKGLTTLYLGVCAALRGGSVITFDINDWALDWVKQAWPPCVQYIHLDALSTVQSSVIEAVSRPNTFVFFDDGDKPKEVGLYAKYIQSGSGCIVHDYHHEWDDPDVLPFLADFTPFMNDVAEQLDSMSRCYIRR